MDPNLFSYIWTDCHKTDLIVFCYPGLSADEIRQCTERFHRTFFDPVSKGKEELWKEHYEQYRANK